MSGNVPLVPSGQNRIEIGEVLIERCPPDTSLLGDLRHRYRTQAMLDYERRNGV